MTWSRPAGCSQKYVDVVHADDRATPETAEKFGSAEPRICTPPLTNLTPETSLGFDVIEFADEVLGIKLLPWQRVALIRMLELNEDGDLRFRTVVILVARQNGKSTLAQVLTIWLLCVWGWPLILGTAQDLDVAEALWEEVVEIIQDNDELADKVANVVKVNGKKALILEKGRKYKVKAANRRAGRGLSGNLVLLDELREHQTWDAWGAITKTTMARAEALILALSNAGDVTSRVLRYLRLLAHKAIGDPDGINAAAEDNKLGPTQFDLDSLKSFDDADVDVDDDLEDLDLEDLDVDELEQDEDTLCLLEWSATPGRDRRDREGWRQANPSLGYTITWKTVAAAYRTDPEWIFRTEVLCQWNDGATSGPFEPGSWERTTIKTERHEDGTETIVNPADRIVSPVMAGIGQSTNGSLVYIALAGWREDGDAQVEVVAGRYGTDWVQEWLESPDRKGRIQAVTGQRAGAPESSILKKLKADRDFRMEVIDMDLVGAHHEAYEQLRRRTAWHPPLPQLDLAAQTAERKTLSGGAWVIDHVHSPIDVAALKAWIAALWALENYKPETPPPPQTPQALAEVDVFDHYDHLTGDLGSIGF